MTDERLLGGPRTRRRLARLTDKSVNFDVADPSLLTRADGWHHDDLCQELPPEAPGMPMEGGSWEIARSLMKGYEFADPSIVRAYYDPEQPLKGRNMLLKLRALGVVRVSVGVRVGDVYEEDRELPDGRAHVWGWTYRTLEGHVERGQMDWEVWKWERSGEVQFRVRSVSRRPPIPTRWSGLASTCCAGMSAGSSSRAAPGCGRSPSSRSTMRGPPTRSTQTAAGRLVARPFAGDADAERAARRQSSRL